MMLPFKSVLRLTPDGSETGPVLVNLARVTFITPSADGVATVLHFGGVAGDYLRVESPYSEVKRRIYDDVVEA